MNINLQDYNFGIDVDNTLTDLPIKFSEIKDLEEARQIIRNVPAKKGVEILQIMCIKPYIITGRGNYFYDDTVYWLEENNIPYKEIITIESDKYKGMKFDFEAYLEHKITAYIENDIDYAMDDDAHVINALKKYDIKGIVVEDDFEAAFWMLVDEE